MCYVFYSYISRKIQPHFQDYREININWEKLYPSENQISQNVKSTLSSRIEKLYSFIKEGIESSARALFMRYKFVEAAKKYEDLL